MKFLYSYLVILTSVLSVFAQAPAAPHSGSSWGSFLPMMIVMFIVIWLLMIRPEQKKQKEKQKLLAALKKGDKVLTIGGIFGTVGLVKDDHVMVKISDNTTVKVLKSAVSTVVTSKDEPAETPEEKKS